ncbi:MAG: hypothetical protein HOV81_38675 [Kofleriaceae bacterium]|nr:hypothetical protein [Kofleriaceae bacterium]
MRIAMTLLALALATSAGCKKKEKAAETGTGSAMVASGAETGSAGSAGSAMAGSDMGSAAGSDMGSAAGSAAGADLSKPNKAGMCPSTVLNTETKATTKGKSVVVTITSKDKDAVASVQKRAGELLAEKKDAHQGEAHDSKGTHGGAAGICPVYVPEGAKAEAKNQADGVAITITPKDKVEDLKTEIDGRITKSADWVKENIQTGEQGNQGGVGGGKGEHGGNHSGEGDGKGKERKGGDGTGGGAGTGGGGGKGTGGGSAKSK